MGQASGYATYRANFSVVAAGAGTALEFKGYAGKTCKITKLTMLVSSAIVVTGTKRSTAAAAAQTGAADVTGKIPLSTRTPAATATITTWTTVPTAGTSVGPVFERKVGTSVHEIEEFGRNDDTLPVELHSASEALTLDVSGAATLSGTIEWAEKNS